MHWADPLYRQVTTVTPGCGGGYWGWAAQEVMAESQGFLGLLKVYLYCAHVCVCVGVHMYSVCACMSMACVWCVCVLCIYVVCVCAWCVVCMCSVCVCAWCMFMYMCRVCIYMVWVCGVYGVYIYVCVCICVWCVVCMACICRSPEISVVSYHHLGCFVLRQGLLLV